MIGPHFIGDTSSFCRFVPIHSRSAHFTCTMVRVDAAMCLFPESLLLRRCLPAMLWQTYLTANSAVVDNSSLFLHYFDILLPSKCRNDSKTKLSAKYRQETCHIQSHGIAYWFSRWGHSTKQLRNKNIFPQSTLRQWFKQCNHPFWLPKCIFVE